MRRRLVISTIAIVLVVLGALALPVGVIVYNAAEQQLDARITDQATTIAAIVGEDIASGRTPSSSVVRDVLGPNDGVEVIDPSGAQILSVPLNSSSTREAVKFTSDNTRVVVSTSAEPLDDNFRQQLSTLLVLALGGIAAAAGLAADLPAPIGEPLGLYSPGVPVRIGWLERVRTENS